MAFPFSFSFDLPEAEAAVPLLAAVPDASPAPVIQSPGEVYPQLPISTLGPELPPVVDSTGNYRRLMTGGTERWINVPQVVAANEAMFAPVRQRLVQDAANQQAAAQWRMLNQPEQPEIFRALRSAERGASEMTGFDPSNPPPIHTLTKAQFLSLPPLLQEQYKMQTERRIAMIDQAQKRTRELANVAIEDALRERRQASQDAEIAGNNLVQAAQDKREADTNAQQAGQKLRDWQIKVNTALAKGWITLNPRTKIYMAAGDSPGAEKIAESINSEKPEIDRLVAEVTKAKQAADRAFVMAQGRAASRRISTVPSLPPIMQGVTQRTSGKLSLAFNPTTGRLELAK